MPEILSSLEVSFSFQDFQLTQHHVHYNQYTSENLFYKVHVMYRLQNSLVSFLPIPHKQCDSMNMILDLHT